MGLLNLLNSIGMVLLFLSKLTIKVAVELRDKLLMLNLQLFNLFSMLGFQALNLLR